MVTVWLHFDYGDDGEDHVLIDVHGDSLAVHDGILRMVTTHETFFVVDVDRHPWFVIRDTLRAFAVFDAVSSE